MTALLPVKPNECRVAFCNEFSPLICKKKKIARIIQMVLHKADK